LKIILLHALFQLRIILLIRNTALKRPKQITLEENSFISQAEQSNWLCVPSREWKREEARESMADFAREKAQDYRLEEFAAQGRAWISHVC